MPPQIRGRYWFLSFLERGIREGRTISSLYEQLKSIAPVVRRTEFLALGRYIKGKETLEGVYMRMPKGIYALATHVVESPLELKTRFLYRYQGEYRDPETGEILPFRRSLASEARLPIWRAEALMEEEVEETDPLFRAQITRIDLVGVEHKRGEPPW